MRRAYFTKDRRRDYQLEQVLDNWHSISKITKIRIMLYMHWDYFKDWLRSIILIGE